MARSSRSHRGVPEGTPGSVSSVALVDRYLAAEVNRSRAVHGLKQDALLATGSPARSATVQS